jgi:hypothetical protein
MWTGTVVVFAISTADFVHMDDTGVGGRLAGFEMLRRGSREAPQDDRFATSEPGGRDDCTRAGLAACSLLIAAA